MTRKEAYLRYIDPSSASPTRSAGQLHKTKNMKAILIEVGRQIDAVGSIRRDSVIIAEKQLALVNSILDGADAKSAKEKLAILRVLKPVQDNAMNVLNQINRPIDEALAGVIDPVSKRHTRGNFMVANRLLEADV